MPIPSVLHLTSDVVPLTGVEARLRDHNAKALAGWQIRVWSDDDNDKLVGEHFPQYLDGFRSLPFGVMRSDVARLVYLHALGGWYADTDYRWFVPPPTEHRIVLPLSRPERLGNAVFGSQAAHPFWGRAVEAVFAQPDLEHTVHADIEARTGPLLLTSLLESIRSEPDVWFAPREKFHAAANEVGPEAIGIHHTRGSWREDRLKWRLGMMRGEAYVHARRLRDRVAARRGGAGSAR